MRSELVAADDGLTLFLWSMRFLRAQGYTLLYTPTLMQDNMSAIQLENNGIFSSHKRMRHVDIRYYFITDQIEKGLLKVEYCPTDEMMADCMSKPLQGEKFNRFRRLIMNNHLAQ